MIIFNFWNVIIVKNNGETALNVDSAYRASDDSQTHNYIRYHRYSECPIITPNYTKYNFIGQMDFYLSKYFICVHDCERKTKFYSRLLK